MFQKICPHQIFVVPLRAFLTKMNSFISYWKSVSGEEKANTLTHLISLIGAIAISWPLLRLAMAANAYAIAGITLFIIGMLQMFASSTIYHAVTAPVHKARLRIFDHISIYVMIAGSYSPICLYVVGGWVGWTLFGFLWACVVVGMITKFVALGKHPHLSLALYLAMGWVALLILKPMWLNMPNTAFWLIVAGGISYTVGTYFFRGDETHSFWHAIWHVFITLGALCHTIAFWLMLS